MHVVKKGGNEMQSMNSYFRPNIPISFLNTNFTPTAASRCSRISSSFPILVMKARDDVAGCPPGSEDTASVVVSSFYQGINNHDLGSVEPLIAENCVYEDLVFSSPFTGRKAILEFFQKFISSTSIDLQFVIDDISTQDSFAVGVTWHLEWKGKAFPFSKGCSFYRLDSNRQIIYGRDCVEPAIKPGDSVLVVLRGLSWLFQKFPQLADRVSKMNI